MANFLLNVSGIRANLALSLKCQDPQLSFQLQFGALKTGETVVTSKPAVTGGAEVHWDESLTLKFDTEALQRAQDTPNLLIHLLENQNQKASGYFPFSRSMTDADQVEVPLADPYGQIVGRVQFELLTASTLGSGEHAGVSNFNLAGTLQPEAAQPRSSLGASYQGVQTTAQPGGASMKEKARIGAVEILTGEQRLLEKLKPALPDSAAAPVPPAETTAPAEHGRAAGSEAANPLKKLHLFEGSPSAAAEAASGPSAAGATKEGAGAPGLAPAPARAPVGPSPPASGMSLGQAPVAAGAGETVGTQTMPAPTARAAGLPEGGVPVQGEAEQSGMGAGLKKALLFGESGGEGVRTEGPEQHTPAQHAPAQHAAAQRTEGVVAQGSGGGVGHTSVAEAVEGRGDGSGLAAGMKKVLLFGEGESRPAEPVTEAAPVVASSGGGVQEGTSHMGLMDKAKVKLHNTISSLQEGMEATKTKLSSHQTTG